MAIQVECPGCGKRYAIAEQFAGKKAKCKNCGHPMMVPQAAGGVAPPLPRPASEPDFGTMDDIENSGQIDDSPYTPVAMGAAVRAPMGTPAPRGTRFDPALAAAATKKVPQPGGAKVGFRINRVVLAMIIGGVVVCTYGLNEMRLASAAGTKPQDITCLQLEEKGPGNNAYIRMSKFEHTSGLVYKKDNATSPSWSEVWVPVVPTNGAYFNSMVVLAAMGKLDESHIPKPTQIKVIVKSKEIHTQDDLKRLGGGRTLQGMVVNQVERISQKEKDLLRSSYPGIDFDSCWIVEEGREPASPGKYLGMLAGGAALVLGGLYVMLKPA